MADTTRLIILVSYPDVYTGVLILIMKWGYKAKIRSCDHVILERGRPPSKMVYAAGVGVGECNGTSIERYVGCGVGAASSLLTVAMVLYAKNTEKVVHRFFLYYALGAVLLSAFEGTKKLTCHHNALYQANTCVDCYFNGVLVLLVCWISAYILLVGVFRLVRLRGWKSELVAIAAVLVLPVSCAWRPGYQAATGQQAAYACGRPADGAGSYGDVAFASVAFLVRLVSALMALTTFVVLARGTYRRETPYHNAYLKAFRDFLPLFVFLLAVSLFGTWGFILSMLAAFWPECPASVDIMRDLFAVSFVSVPLCYAFLVLRVRCAGKKSLSESTASIGSVADEV